MLLGWEAAASVSLGDRKSITSLGGEWHSLPHCVDAIFHVGGFVLYGGDVCQTRDFFYVTPGWESCRILRKFKPGDKFRSYVRMSRMALDEQDCATRNMCSSVVYVLPDDEVVGMMRCIKSGACPELSWYIFSRPAEF